MRSSEAIAPLPWLKWLTMNRSPPGLQTRFISSTTFFGSGATDTTYIATTLSKLLSAYSSACASINASEMRSALPLTRALAYSSISGDTSIPTTSTSSA